MIGGRSDRRARRTVCVSPRAVECAAAAGGREGPVAGDSDRGGDAGGGGGGGGGGGAGGGAVCVVARGGVHLAGRAAGGGVLRDAGQGDGAGEARRGLYDLARRCRARGVAAVDRVVWRGR